MRQTFVFIGLFLLSGASYAAETNAPPGATTIPEKPVVTHHSIKVDGTALNYTATAGFLPLKDEAG